MHYHRDDPGDRTLKRSMLPQRKTAHAAAYNESRDKLSRRAKGETFDQIKNKTGCSGAPDRDGNHPLPVKTVHAAATEDGPCCRIRTRPMLPRKKTVQAAAR